MANPISGDGEHDVADLVVRAAHRLRRHWMSALEPWELSPHEFRALRAALDFAVDGGAARLSDVAERLRIAPRSATEVVDSLEAKGLVRRAPSPTDRRAVLVEPTEQGRALAAEIGAQRSVLGAEMLQTLSDEERRRLGELLHKVIADDPGPR